MRVEFLSHLVIPINASEGVPCHRCHKARLKGELAHLSTLLCAVPDSCELIRTHTNEQTGGRTYQVCGRSARVSGNWYRICGKPIGAAFGATVWVTGLAAEHGKKASRLTFSPYFADGVNAGNVNVNQAYSSPFFADGVSLDRLICTYEHTYASSTGVEEP
jgi:hypothetical protein